VSPQGRRLEELVTYVDAPCYFRDEPRHADDGMSRFAAQMKADAAHKAAMEGLSTERMTWEEYAATHPHESIGTSLAVFPRAKRRSTQISK
jgi:hypothetical protein